MSDRVPTEPTLGQDVAVDAPCACASRRGLLRLGLGAAAGLAAVPVLAACGGSSGGAANATATGGAGGGGTATAGGGTSGSGGGSTGGAGTQVAALAKVPVGGAVVVQFQGKTVIVSQPQSGTVHAFDAACTHQGCPVAPEGGRLVCPCHGSVFTQDSGAVVQGPAQSPLTRIPVSISGDKVVTA